MGTRQVRELTQDDLDNLEANPPAKARTAVVKHLRHTHHLAARLIAEGRKSVEVASITGYSISRISILKQDPAFAELVEYYHTQTVEQFTNIHERLASFGFTCLEEAQERLERSPEDFSLNQLREWLETVLDRSIAPKKGGGVGIGGAPGPVQINVEFHTPAPSQGPIVEVKATVLAEPTQDA